MDSLTPNNGVKNFFFSTLMTLTEKKSAKYILITWCGGGKSILSQTSNFLHDLIQFRTLRNSFAATENSFYSIIFHVSCTTESSSIFHVEINKTFFRIILQAHCEFVHPHHPFGCFDNVCCLPADLWLIFYDVRR